MNNACVEVCGDGVLLSTSSMACDDGNTVNGDGCSSVCQVEEQYRCENGSSTTPSACYYIGSPLTLELLSTRRTEGLNQGVFEFGLFPPLLTVGDLNLSHYLAFTCQSAYTIASLEYRSGVLTITADYSEDLEKRDCVLTLSYDPSLILSPTSTLDFIVQSDNDPLTISTKLAQFADFSFIFRTLSYISMVLFALSLPHKLIGA
jgi:cysteine-rich repeat protein